ncbi:glycosyl transferase family 1 [Shewanella hafniensis]|uniref:glycosyltransferase n=1 Tax=Shewanella hafniensis TaxID=365590 RepID=UPI001BBB9D3F|nr:glycosyltransferase [Shewanella hafniensis]MCL1133022.1 glycosyltransferase [Shewanella hafniensis]GIU38123.1 glycosyl transferase family 1 [Shewanella hafniensis]
MKIAFIIPTLTLGGAEKIALDTAVGMAELGNDVYLIALSERHSHFNLDEYKSVGIKFLKNPFQLLQLLYKLKPDLCISYMERANLITGLLCFILNLKFIATVHTAPKNGFLNRNLINRLFIFITYKLLALLNAPIACVSRGVADEIKFIYKAKNVHVIPNFINFKKVDSEYPVVQVFENREYDVLFVGRLSKIKGCDLLVDAICKIHHEIKRLNFKILIIGDGPESKILQQKISYYGLDEYVTFNGAAKEPFYYMNRSKFLVVPSYAEGFGLVILEGLALGCEIIYSMCDFGPREIIGEHMPCMAHLRFLDPCVNRNEAVNELSKLLLISKSKNESCSPIKKRDAVRYNFSKELTCRTFLSLYDLN